MIVLTYIYLPHYRASSMDSFLFTLPNFYINFICLQLCFCSVFVHLITEFELDLKDISSWRSQVRALHFYSFAVWLPPTSGQPREYNIKAKEGSPASTYFHINSRFLVTWPAHNLLITWACLTVQIICLSFQIALYFHHDWISSLVDSDAFGSFFETTLFISNSGPFFTASMYNEFLVASTNFHSFGSHTHIFVF